MRKSKGGFLITVLLAFTAMVLTCGCQAASQNAAETAAPPKADVAQTVPCAPATMLIKEITPEARLVGLDCYFDQYRKVKSLHIRVAVANQSSRQQRFRVNIFLPDGKAVGGLLPRKAGTGLVKPGETVSFTYPIKGLADAPRQMTLQVMAMGRLTTMRSVK